MGKNINEVLHVYNQDAIILFSEYKDQSQNTTDKLKQKGLDLVINIGNKIKIALVASSILSEGQSQQGWIITFHDITKEQELEEMNLDFVSMAAHELRTPLTAIRGYASLLHTEIEQKLDTDGKQLINR